MNFSERSRESMTLINRVFMRVRENEYVNIKTTVKPSEIDGTITKLIAQFREKLPICGQLRNEI